MIITDQHRDDILRQANIVQRFLYATPTAGENMFRIAKKYDLDKNEEIYSKFAFTVGDIILGFYRVQDTVPLLQQELGIDPRTAALLGADVLDFLAPLSDPTWQPPRDPNDDIDETPEPVPSRPQVLPTEPYNQTLQGLGNTPTPVAPNQNWTAPAAPPAPSLNSPLHFEPVHTATGQDAIRQPLSQIPSYNSQPSKSAPEANIEPPPQWGRY